MNRHRIGMIALLALSLFLSPGVLAGTSCMPTDIALEGSEGAASLAEDAYGLTRRNDPVSILVYTEYADLEVGAEYDNTMASLDEAYGTSYQYANLADFTKLSAVIDQYDVLLVPEQEDASGDNMTAIGVTWSDVLEDFALNGGIVILMDYGYSELGSTAKIYNASGLMELIGPFDLTGFRITVDDYDDALALGVGEFEGPNGAIGFSTYDGNRVMGNSSYAQVVHKTLGQGHVLYLGFDNFVRAPETDAILANAVRLHHHVVFDASHEQENTVSDEFRELAVLLSSAGFAVTTMSVFDMAILAACDVLFVSFGYIVYNDTEVNQIEEFVANGGGLFVAHEFAGYGHSIDPIAERFGYVRNKTTYFEDSDDYVAGLHQWVIFNPENAHNHSATILATELEVYGGTGFVQVPETAYPLFVTDTDGTTTFEGSPADDLVFSAASAYQKGRILVIGDTSLFVGSRDTDSDGTVNVLDRDNGVFAVNSVRWLLAAGIEEKKVLFDESHTPFALVTGESLNFAYFLTLNGYTVHWMQTFNLGLISQADVLFIMDGNIDYTSTEIEQIAEYVADGKSLFLIGDWSIYGQQVGAIGSVFDLQISTTAYLDDIDDWLVFSSYLVYNASSYADHPIMEGVSRLELDRSCGFSSIGAGTALVQTDTDGSAYWVDGYNTPADGVAVFVSRIYNKGRVVFLTDINFVLSGDPDSDGVIHIYDSDNDRFLSNALNWLVENRAPVAHLTFPNGGESLNGTQIVTWTALDFDNDIMTYDLFYSADNGTSWASLVTGLLVTEYAWNSTQQADGNSYMIRVAASDGEATGMDSSDNPFTLDNTAEGATGLDPLVLVVIGAAIAVVIVVILVVMKKQGRI